MTGTTEGTFGDLDRYIELPRLTGLALSFDGTRLVTSVAALNADRTRHVTSLWQVDPQNTDPPRRLTRSKQGESKPTFLPDGTLLFVSEREDPTAGEDDEGDPLARLLALPAGGGESQILTTRRGGFEHIATARDSGTVVAAIPTLPGSSVTDDDRRRKDRKDRKINAVLHTSYPIRYWDQDLGPDHNRLFLADHPGIGATDSNADLRDLTPRPGRALDSAEFDISPDGHTVVTTWWVPHDGGRRLTLQRLDTGSGTQKPLLDDAREEFASPSVSPDSRRVAALRATLSTVDRPPRYGLVVVELDSGDRHDVATPVRSPLSWPVWMPDGTAVLACADDQGRRPIFRIDVSDGTTTRLTGDDAAYDDIVVSPDGGTVYAVRNAVDAPPAVVRLDSATADQHPTVLWDPAGEQRVPGTVTEVTATAVDGTPLRAWLCQPDGASSDQPASLLLWVHGGPLSSWNAWSWRWNPWLMVAREYAVLLPDPALSTGYGDAMVARGWGAWGQAPFTDLMALTDAALARDDTDGDHTAAMGGSFGGYMANWIAGHTDRFDAIVTHASLWALDQFGPTTDAYDYWRRELSPEMAAANSPHLHADAITTPMLVIHGDKDYRVPVGEGLRLWAELAERHQGADGQMPHRFLLFPDEHHWVLKPQHTRLWYETVFAFLDWHVHGGEWRTPELLT